MNCARVHHEWLNTVNYLPGAELPVLKAGSEMMQLGRKLSKAVPESVVRGASPFSPGWDLWVPRACPGSVVGLPLPGRGLTDLAPLSRFPAMALGLPVITVLPDNPCTVHWIWLLSPALILTLILTPPQIMSHCFGLALWAGLFSDSDNHNLTSSACLAQLSLPCLASVGLCPCQYLWPSCCHCHLPKGLPMWESLLLLLLDMYNLPVLHPHTFFLLPSSNFWCHWSFLPSWHFTPTRLEDCFFFRSSSPEDCSCSWSFDEYFCSFPTVIIPQGSIYSLFLILHYALSPSNFISWHILSYHLHADD